MGRKVHPIGFRLGTVRDWRAKWHADKHFADYLHEDLKLRDAIRNKYSDAGISQVEIERQANKVAITIHTSRPGIVIGRGGQRVESMRHYLDEIIGKKTQLNIKEVTQPELDAYLVARSIAEQIERRVAYRRAMKQAIFRTIQAGAQGIKVNLSGRLGGAEIARAQVMHQGRVPLHTLRADIDYGYTQAHTAMGRIGIKVWIYRGDVLPETAKEEELISEPIIAEPVEAEETAEKKEAEVKKEETAEKAVEEVKEEKPKKKRATKAKTEEPAEEVKEEKPKRKRTVKAKTEESAEEVKKEEKPEALEEQAEELEEKPKKKRTKKAKAEKEDES